MPDPIADTSAQTPPVDFEAYEQWRSTSEDPLEAPAAEVVTPEAEPAKPAPEPAPDSEPGEQQEHGQKGRGFQKRINQLTARIHELEARGSQPASEKPAPVEPQQPAVDEPKAEDFQTYDAYVKALTRYELKAEREAERKAVEQRAAQTEQQKQQTAWEDRRSKAVEQHPDWDEVVGSADVPVSRAMHDALLDSDHGPEIAYQLAKDPDEAKRISALSPLAQIKAIGRLEAQFESTPEPEKPKASKAPRPPKPVSGGGAAPRLDGDISYGDYERLRKAQDKRG